MWSFRPQLPFAVPAPGPLATAFLRGATLVTSASFLVGSSTAYAQTTGTLPPPVAPSASAEQVSPPGAAGTAPAPSKASRPRKELVWTGASLFALSYLASAIAATTDYPSDTGASYRAALWIPVVGPFVQMGSESSAVVEVLLVLDGLAQMGGLTMFVCGLVSPTPLHGGSETKSGFHISVAPLVTRNTSWAMLSATF